jgi:hypothetical protein
VIVIAPDLMTAIADARETENRRHAEVIDALDGMERSARRLGMLGSSRDASRVDGPRRPGRRAGGVRRAITDLFDGDPGMTWTAEGVLGAMAQAGVETNAANVHQHLGRLVKAGVLERPHRGVYRRAGLRVAS